MKRILHLGDLHLDDTATLGGNPAADSSGRCLAMTDTVRAVDQVVERAGQIDGIVLAGDVLDKAAPCPNVMEVASDLLDNLKTRCANGAVLVLDGNHDVTKSPSDAPGTIFLRRQPGVILVSRPAVVEYCGLRWACLPYPRKSAIRETLPTEAINGRLNALLSAALYGTAIGLQLAGGQILLAHSTAAGATVGIQPRTIEGDIEIARDTMDLFEASLFGHIHDQQKLPVTPWAWFSGAPTPHNFGDEGKPRGGLVWTFDDNGHPLSVEPIHVDVRHWQTVDVDETLTLPDMAPGEVWRIRGELPHDRLSALRARLIDIAGTGVFIHQSELQLRVENRMRDAEAARDDLSHGEVFRRGLAADKVPEADHGRLTAKFATLEA